MFKTQSDIHGKLATRVGTLAQRLNAKTMNKNFSNTKIQQTTPALRQPTIGSRVFATLRQSIVQQKILPGQPLSEAEVAKQMGVSRQPVREAFIKLAETGLVEVRPQRGTYVTLISEQEVENARFIREVVEVALARRAAVAISDADIADLQALIAEQSAVGAAEEYSQFLALDEKFHVRISEVVDCAYAWRMLENLKAQIDRVRFLTLPDRPTTEKVISQHQAIVDAFSTRSPDLAEVSMRQHMKEIITTLPSMVLAHPSLFVS